MHGMWNDEPRRRQHGGRRNDMGWGGAWGAGPMGPPPWLAQLLGQEMAGRRGRHGSGRPRVRRGDVRSAILDVLGAADEPVNGYQVIQQIAERTGGQWKPSPGSVYPTIQQLEDEGLVEDAPTGRKALQLTAEGRDWVADHAAELAALWKPFEAEEGAEDVNFKQVIGQTVGAIAQVMSSGTPDQRDKALGILADTRRRLYGLLADGPETDDVEADDLDDELDGREGR